MDTVAVVGVGYWGRKHVQEFRAIGARVLAVDSNPEARAWARDEAGAEPVADLDAALADPATSAVTICTPNATHYALARKALEAGKHVFVEKPLALTSREGRELVALALKHKRTLVVGHVFRFNNAVRAAKQMMEYGEFGKTVLVKLTWANAEPLFADRDVIFDLAPHAFDVLHFLFGRYPDTIGCTAGAFRRKTGPEIAFLQGRVQDTLYQFELSWLSPKRIRRLELIGLKKSLVAELSHQRVEVFENGGWRELNVVPNNTIRAELESFLSVIENGNAHVADGEIGVSNLEMLEMAHAALEHPGVIPTRPALTR